MRSYLMIALLVLTVLLCLPHQIYAESESIQQQIDAAEPGETITLKAGEYEESLVINKPIRLIGTEEVILKYQGSSSAITIQADEVTVDNIKIKYINDGSQSAAMLIQGNDNLIHNVEINTNSFGIQLDEAHHNTIAYSKIHGDPRMRLIDRKHGIDLWQSHHNEIYENVVRYVSDGIYIERSQHNEVRQNSASHSRYGYHLMFTKHTHLTQNESFENISGMMIMGTEGTIAQQNILMHNQRNVQSLGLLLFDVKDAVVSENEIINNRVGVLIENAKHNELTQNLIQGNYIGVRFKVASENMIHHNAFIANVVQGQAEQSDHNDVHENYWADHVGIDLTGDETSDLAYHVDPFFLTITDAYPPFQLLFQAPGMIFLEQLIDIPEEEQLIDQAPLMVSPISNLEDQQSSQLPVFMLSLAFLLLSLFIIYLGVKVNEKV